MGLELFGEKPEKHMKKNAFPEKQHFLNYTINYFLLNVDVTMEVCFMASFNLNVLMYQYVISIYAMIDAQMLRM